MNLPIVYSFRRCPYAMRARMALHVAEVDCEYREVVLRNKPPQLLEASPKGTVPVLVLPDGTVIDESLHIMAWALAQHDPHGWRRPDIEAASDALIAVNDGPFKHHLDRYKYAQRYEGAQADLHRAEGLKHLQALEAQLAEGAQLFGARTSLADIAIFPFVRQFANADRVWFDAQALPRLQSWLQTHLDSQLFELIMVKREPWVHAGSGGLVDNQPG